MDPFDSFKVCRIATSRITKSPEMSVPSPSLGQSPRVTTQSLTLIPNRNTTSPHESYHPRQPPFHPNEAIPDLHNPLVHSSISPQNASSQASSENTLAPSIPTTSTEIHFNNPNNVVITNTNTPTRTTTSSADDTDVESTFDWASRGGSGGV
ncbi:hypothetical protein BLNAU_15488 [Blattamonas nauphoetae]|uniref:Uncharacterized protein n=1 Tax=Blattamonas nauphoetae TaxID=2049346 RepID=A0ABQ9WS44_9EUKA|nr:hypothetical protein BLNAU_22792 [Blattamonas nauphoetae]KAK2949628.1 hypothetical protein BLNAU_15488 [Blattamonas nauphoetae]